MLIRAHKVKANICENGSDDAADNNSAENIDYPILGCKSIAIGSKEVHASPLDYCSSKNYILKKKN